MPVGYAALLDVLGFSNLVSGEGAATRLAAYRDGLQTALGAATVGVNVEYVVFSDSIVITTPDDSDQSLQTLIRRCSNLLGLMLERDIALRGAIACGSYERTAVGGSVFIAGTAILDAYRFETAQDWVGIMLTPSVLRRIPDLEARCSLGTYRSTREAIEQLCERLPWAAFVQRCSRIPFHAKSPFDDHDFEGFAVVPTTGPPEPIAISESLTRALGKLQWLKSLAPDPAAQAKYKNAHQWLDSIKQQWREILGWVEQFTEQDRAAASKK
jgi:hypothetical protein